MKKFECKNCGAELYWDSNANCLKCEYCDAEFQPSDFGVADAELENETTQEKTEPEKADEYAKATDDSDSIELVVYKCNHCGAEIVTAKSTIATTCAYCGRAISITDKMVDNFKPDLVIPFSVDEGMAKELYKKYIHKYFLTPKSFLKEHVVKKMKGIYAPYWLHSFVNTTNAVVYGENVKSRRRGNDKIIEHYIYNVSVEASGTFSHVPTDALKNMENNVMDALEPYDFEKLQQFNPAYMAGFYAEEYGEDQDTTIHRAIDRTKEYMKSRVEAEAGAYKIKRVMSATAKISNRVSQYAMLPVWLLHVEYNKKEYLYAINGQTGKVVGDLPIDWKKFALATVGTLMGSYVIISLIKLLMLLGGFL